MSAEDREHPVTLKSRASQVADWDRAAEAAGMSRNAWAMAILDAACGRSELPKQLRRVGR